MKKIIIFTLILMSTITIACGGGSGGGDNEDIQGKMVIKSNVDSNLSFNKIITTPFRFMSNVFASNLYADSGLGGSPFTKVNGIGLMRNPSIAICTARNGNYKVWRVTESDGYAYEPQNNTNTSKFISETQKLTYDMVNKFYNYPDNLTDGTYGTYYKLINMDVPETFEIDYIICGFGGSNIYGETVNGNAYAPYPNFFNDSGDYVAYNENAPYEVRCQHDSIHPMAPNEFKSYTRLIASDGLNVCSETRDGSIIFSTKVTTPVFIAFEEYGNVDGRFSSIPDDLKADLTKIVKGHFTPEGSSYAEPILVGGIYIVVPMSWLGYGDNISIATQQAVSMETPIEITIDLQKIIVRYERVIEQPRVPDYPYMWEVNNTKDISEIQSSADLPFGMKFVLDPSIIR